LTRGILLGQGLDEAVLDGLTSGLLGVAAAYAAHESTVSAASASDPISTPFSTVSLSDWAEAVGEWNAHGRHLIAGLAARDCPACGDRRRRHLFDSYDGYPHVECLACGCWYVPLKVEAELFDRFFVHCPKAQEVLQRAFQGRQTEASRQSSLERIGAYLDVLVPMLAHTQSPSYLDMGCGRGESLLAARERGLTALGVESSRECIGLGKGAGLEILHVCDPAWQAQRFDLISFWESLEHMDDPFLVLQQSAVRLAPKGLLAFSVPNQNCPLVRTQREDCSFVHGGYDTPGHINLFNPETIGRLLDRAGYHLLSLDGQYGMNLGELVSYLLCRHRGAYDLLRGHEVQARLSDEGVAILRSIGPAFSVLERVTLTTPILFGFACRKEDAGYFARAAAEHDERRRRQLLVQIESMQPGPPAAEQQHRWREAMERIQAQVQAQASELRDLRAQLAGAREQLLISRNPLERLRRFIRGKSDRTKG
jgi:SAM-dependent methyltransferase